ncbi:hypothetical protein [Rhizobium ruizarguesonis]|uniref:hypothetical protein n=1 Tax=Rhizobium ruizarguesonis TaxID=2081791 RepID=UPI00102FB320|nr:hypothetical protein [Rhizobium ruizarguesonis]TAU28674.1 hypothetical protein ELI48_22325 [Rhizobium ruizarguesonis]TAU70672.1 hypothetical protein ELI45_23980 [Rhizobium ruizarguesonis]TAV17816.1 hypothetical protein ELI34_21670 [Rhizobium ruizarguesonis]TAW11987.1 hypothetical protein ELI26_21805 [Rhizobium ruizarguesonis]TAW74622.1 hypothetical protein ELI16_23025 [Rhizobium ruizarguesonis]
MRWVSHFEENSFPMQCPRAICCGTLASKIEKDFEGALESFGDRMKIWVFVHNQNETPSRAVDLLHQLRKKHPDLELKIWTLTHLVREIRALSEAALRNLFRGFSFGHEFSEPMEQFIASQFGQSRPPIPTEAVEPQPSNRNDFNEAMDRLGEVDREVRRRLLGYSRWFDPATKSEVNGRIMGHGFEEAVIVANAQRLHDEKLLAITEHHYLVTAEDVCQQAADTLMDEFLTELLS